MVDLKALGLQEGHILAVNLPTGQEFISLLFASIQIGAIFCPLNNRLPEAAIQAQLQILQPKLYISPAGIQQFQAPKHPLPPASFLLFTSGSSATPKIVSLTHANFLAAASSAVPACELEPGDTWLLSLPLYHVGGLAILFRCHLAGANYTLDPSNPKITHLSYVPTQLHRSWPIYPRLKTILLGGAPIHNIPSRLPILASYGMTETASLFLGKKNAVKKNGFYYLGHPHPGKQMRLSPDGEIHIKGDSLFQGYWNGTALQKPGEWFATKDLGHFDPELGYAIIGRKDNQFISGGENIQPEEIERELLTHPNVLEAIVVPKPDEEFGHRPVAFVRLSTPTDLSAYLRERLPKYKIPTDFLLLEETEK